MPTNEYAALKSRIEEEYRKKLKALEVLFGNPDLLPEVEHIHLNGNGHKETPSKRRKHPGNGAMQNVLIRIAKEKGVGAVFSPQEFSKALKEVVPAKSAELRNVRRYLSRLACVTGKVTKMGDWYEHDCSYRIEKKLLGEN